MKMGENVRDHGVARFEELVTNLQKLVDPGYGTEKVYNRVIAITEFIKDVLNKLEEITPQLKVSEILPVGGFNEGTKILSADEFDFLVVVEELSKPGVFTIEKEEHSSSKVKLKLCNLEDVNGKWRKFNKNGYLSCFEAVLQTSVEDSFGFRVLEAMSKLHRNKGRAGIRENNQIVYYGKPPEIIYNRTKPAEQFAFIKRAEVNYPNVLLEFVFDGEIVTADLCPAIRYTNTADCFDPEFCGDKRLSDAVMDRGSILLVGQDRCQFGVTYTETEVEYMKHNIQKGHKCLYILLKVIAHFFKRLSKVLPSYVLKIICIKHDLECNIEENNNSLLDCFDEVIKLLRGSLNESRFLSVFDGRLNVLRISFDTILPAYRQVNVVPALDKIRKLCHETTTTLPENFMDQVKAIVESEEAKYDLMKLLHYKNK